LPDRAVGRFSSLYVLASGKRWRKPLSVTVLSLAENIGRRGPDGKTNRFVQSTHGTLEVASLRTHCLSRDTAGPVLIYDNHKARRPGRRLPILQSTADAINDWVDVRSTILASSQEYLFPGTAIVEKHLSSNSLSSAIRTWVRGLETLTSDEIDANGDPLPFDRSKIHPYAFRHSYAQRHADNGTPVDVLRQLMDHRSIQTTGGYYTITADRKRSAIETSRRLGGKQFATCTSESGERTQWAAQSVVGGGRSSAVRAVAQLRIPICEAAALKTCAGRASA